ncbi:MAG TPA: hypothetical protein VI112_12360 [Bacteroidia bacterium]|jgi:hypothetical protein
MISRPALLCYCCLASFFCHAQDPSYLSGTMRFIPFDNCHSLGDIPLGDMLLTGQVMMINPSGIAMAKMLLHQDQLVQ